MSMELVAESWPRRMVKALPDLIMAGIFLWVWLDPSGWRRQLVAQGLLIMLLEFILIHSSAFFGMALFAPGWTRGKRLRLLLGLGVFYGLFVTVWSWQFRSWWPLLFFAWLLGGRLAAVLLNRRAVGELRWRQYGLMALSTLLFLLCVPGALLLPLPRLGLVHHGHVYGLTGSGEWVSHPHTAIAALVLYFGLLALGKWLAWDRAIGQLSRAQSAQQGQDGGSQG